MTEDKELRGLFASAVTEFDDNEQFIANLLHSLDKVEYIKQIHKAHKRQYRIRLATAFVAGAISAIATMMALPYLLSNVKFTEFMMLWQLKFVFGLCFSLLCFALMFGTLSVISDLRSIVNRQILSL